jgi:hypothetical protein
MAWVRTLSAHTDNPEDTLRPMPVRCSGTPARRDRRTPSRLRGQTACSNVSNTGSVMDRIASCSCSCSTSSTKCMWSALRKMTSCRAAGSGRTARTCRPTGSTCRDRQPGTGSVQGRHVATRPTSGCSAGLLRRKFLPNDPRANPARQSHDQATLGSLAARSATMATSSASAQRGDGARGLFDTGHDDTAQTEPA